MTFCQDTYNKSAAGKAARARYNATPKGKATLRAAMNRVNLRSKGTTPEEREAKFIKQGKCCGSCGAIEPGRKDGKWHTDHNHKTGKFRGVLCQPCNIALGWLEQTKRNAALRAYLERTDG